MILRPRPKHDKETGQCLPNRASAKADLNKFMAEAGLGKFLSILKYKAQGMDKKIFAINPAHTSQKCSGYGEIEKKTLSIRMHDWTRCGLILNRDHNAAINRLRLGLQAQGFEQAPPKIAAA